VVFHTHETLAVLIARHRADNSVPKATSKLIRADLIVIDHIGITPVSHDQAEAVPRRRRRL
jgi:DNA replication protein DnaC